MPYLAKRTISNFLRSKCLRRLRLDLSPDNATYQAERAGMPPKAAGRPGIAALTTAGNEWEEAKIADLRTAFGPATIIAPAGGALDLDLATALAQRTAQTLFITQGQYSIGNAFQTALAIEHYATALNLAYGRLRPDIIRLWPTHTGHKQVNPDGSTTAVNSITDNRIPLSIVDIKLTAEASACYQAEVTYYSMALAAWLIDHNLHTQYFVVPLVCRPLNDLHYQASEP